MEVVHSRLPGTASLLDLHLSSFFLFSLLCIALSERNSLFFSCCMLPDMKEPFCFASMWKSVEGKFVLWQSVFKIIKAYQRFIEFL